METLAEDTSANSDSRAERPQKSESDRADQIVVVTVTEHNSVSRREDGDGRIENINIAEQDGLLEQHRAGCRLRRTTQLRHQACRNTHRKVRW